MNTKQHLQSIQKKREAMSREGFEPPTTTAQDLRPLSWGQRFLDGIAWPEDSDKPLFRGDQSVVWFAAEAAEVTVKVGGHDYVYNPLFGLSGRGVKEGAS